MHRVGASLLATLLAAGAVSADAARATDAQQKAAPLYASKPVRIISPLASGGSGDTLARMVGETLAEALGQPVVIDNRPGANGIIGVELVVKAAPDGYTLLVASGGNMVINPALYGAKLPFNVERDLVPITQIATQSFIAHVSPAFPATSIKALIAIPTIAEAGVPGYNADAWYGMFAPRGTPGSIVAKLFAVLNQSLRAPERQEKLNAQGVEAVGSTPAEFAAYVKSETVKWTKAVKESDVKPDY